MNSRCKESDRLRFKWYETNSVADLSRLKLHYRTCRACRSRQVELTEQARNAVMPPLEDEELEYYTMPAVAEQEIP
jgi:hypothetical protein